MWVLPLRCRYSTFGIPALKIYIITHNLKSRHAEGLQGNKDKKETKKRTNTGNLRRKERGM
jgi:hypothetical protein